VTDSPKYGEADLQAWVDGGLDVETRANIDAWLAENPDVARRLEAYARQNAALHEAFDPVLDEPVPARLLTAATGRATAPAGIWSVWRIAAAIGFLAIGGLSGWIARDQWPRANDSQIAEYAFNAHTVYVAEKRHAVEVQAAEEKHLVSWLSKRLGQDIRMPDLIGLGYRLVGGRLLPDGGRPTAQFMYENESGGRLTVYVQRNELVKETSFRFIDHKGVSAFYWVDEHFAYVLAGAIQREDLLDAARIVHDSLAR
jgi:anti-sigma factor RsiW